MNQPGLLLKYFVLKPRGSDAFAAASRAAMLTYAEKIAAEDPELAQSLRAWIDAENNQAQIEVNVDEMVKIAREHAEGKSPWMKFNNEEPLLKKRCPDKKKDFAMGTAEYAGDL